MKKCPQCGREYDNTMSFCLDDGAELLYGPSSSGHLSQSGAVATGFRPGDEPQTAILQETATPGEAATRAQIHTTERTAVLPGGNAEPRKAGSFDKRLLLVPLALSVVVLGGFFGYQYFKLSRQIESIAVMPLVNSSGDADSEYLSDGMTETLINSLAQIPNLAVKGRGSVFRYKGKDTEPKQIASELGVEAVLSGRLLKRGESVTLSLDLVDASTGNQIWGEQYERKLSDIASLQKEIARDVSNKLKTRLSGTDQPNLAKGQTTDPEAYQLYLQGLYQWNKRTIDTAARATELFQKAIDKDPKFALAYVGLANSYIINDRPADYNVKAKAAAEKALAIDPSLGEAHTVLGNVAFYYEWDFKRSEDEFKKAIELNPNYPTAHHWYGETLAAMGRFDESYAEYVKAVELDPVSMAILTDQAMAYIYAKQFDQAIERLKKLIDIDPNYVRTHFYLAAAYEGKGMFAEATESFKKGLLLDGMPPERAETVAKRIIEAVKNSGADGYWKVRLELATERASHYGNADSVDVIEMGIGNANLGNNDQAFEFLEKGFKARRVGLVFLKVDYVWDKIRFDPRFADLIRRVGLP